MYYKHTSFGINDEIKAGKIIDTQQSNIIDMENPNTP